MAAGLPGTGIGGLFFILSAFGMLVVEIVQTVRGRSSWERWRIVLRHVGIAAAMVAAVTATIWGAHRLLYPAAPHRARGGGTAEQPGEVNLVPLAPVLVTVAVLAAVLAAAYVHKLVARPDGARR